MAVWNEVRISNVVDKDRMDADYFQEQYIELDKYVAHGIPISRIASTVDLQSNGSFSRIFNILNDNEHKEVPYIRSGNVGDFFLDRNELHFISKKAHDLLKKTHTIYGDIIMARKGKIGGATLITEDDVGLNSNDNVVNIRIKDQRFLAEYFVAFWNCKYGLNQVQRLATGNVQPWLSMKQVRMLRTVLLDYKDQLEISNIVNNAYIKNKLSKSLYNQAQDLLEKELGLDQMVLNKHKSYESSFYEVVGSQRMDADFHQPIYQGIEEKFNNFKRIKIGDIVSYPISSGATPKSGGNAYTDTDIGVPFIRVVDFQDIEVDEENFIYIKKSIHEKLLKKTKLRKNDILFSIAGTVGRCVIFNHDFEANINQAVSIIRFDENIIKRLYLLAFFHSKIGKLYVKKFARQGVQTNLTLKEVSDLSIPIINMDIQDNIVHLIEESMKCQKESELLLEQAKKRVEDLIEGVI